MGKAPGKARRDREESENKPGGGAEQQGRADAEPGEEAEQIRPTNQ